MGLHWIPPTVVAGGVEQAKPVTVPPVESGGDALLAVRAFLPLSRLKKRRKNVAIAASSIPWSNIARRAVRPGPSMTPLALLRARTTNR